VKYIKIYGAPRSGTNNIRHLLNINFDNTTAFMDLLGFRQWGHPVQVDWSGRDWSIQQRKQRKNRVVKQLLSTVTPGLIKAHEEDDIRYVVIVRHPCATYLSRIRKRFEGKELKNALNQPVGVFWFTLYWNAAYWNWYQQILKLKPLKSILIKHEDIVFNYQDTMKKIQGKFGLIPNSKSFKKVDKKLHPSGLDSMIKPKLETVNYNNNYDNKKFVYKLLGPKVMAEFKSYADDELMKNLGYTI